MRLNDPAGTPPHRLQLAEQISHPSSLAREMLAANEADRAAPPQGYLMACVDHRFHAAVQRRFEAEVGPLFYLDTEAGGALARAAAKVKLPAG